MIPKILHFIWVGKDPLPDQSSDYINMFKLMYDDYEIKLWKDMDVIENELIPDFLNDYYFNNDFTPAFKADILRYLILQKYGGLYFDTDFEPLKKLPDCFLLFDFLGAIQPNEEVAIGFIASIKNNLLINEIIQNIPHSIEISKLNGFYDSRKIHKITGPEFFDPIANKYKNRSDHFFFTKEYFYPYWFTEDSRKSEIFKITSPLSYAVHHWNMSWKL